MAARRIPIPLVLTQRFMAMLERDFKYTISAPPVGFNATDDFLFETRLGFCQHFSSAYAVFMRAAGVPTRVVTGYVGGHCNKIGEYWLLKGKDAHAWTEIWLDGRGWVRVDPTAAIAPENILDTLDDLQARQQAGLAGRRGRHARADVRRHRFPAQAMEPAGARLQCGPAAEPAASRSASTRPGLATGHRLRHRLGAGAGLTLWFLLREHRDRSHPGRLAALYCAAQAGKARTLLTPSRASARPGLVLRPTRNSDGNARIRSAGSAQPRLRGVRLARRIACPGPASRTAAGTAVIRRPGAAVSARRASLGPTRSQHRAARAAASVHRLRNGLCRLPGGPQARFPARSSKAGCERYRPGRSRGVLARVRRVRSRRLFLGPAAAGIGRVVERSAWYAASCGM